MEADGADKPDVDLLRKEIGFYRKRSDELAGENLKLDYTISGMRHKLRQKQQGFSLLSELQQKLGTGEISEVFERVIGAVNGTLSMEKTIFLIPGGEEHVYKAGPYIGFKDEDAARLEAAHVRLPPGFADGTDLLLVHKKVEETPIIQGVRAALELPYFIAVPIIVENAPIGILVSGRTKEAKPLYPPLDEGDVDTFRSIASFIGASVRNMRVGVLEKMDQLKTQFFANISHEFRTPITLTLGPLEGVAAGRYGKADAGVQEQVEVMLRNQRRLLQLVNQILDLAKLESGKMQLKAVRVSDFNGFVRRVMKQFESMAEKRGLKHGLELDPAVDGAELYLDAELTDKMLFNLLSNAHKFTKQGSITLKTSIDGQKLVVEVSDTGVGIRADQIPHLFDRFRQADGSSSREYAGTGLGLSLVKEAAELHGGDVKIFSEYGQGTTFRVVIPLGKAHLDQNSISAQGEEPAPHVSQNVVVDSREGKERGNVDELNAETVRTLDKNRPTVLYVDDNGDLRMYIHGILKAHGYNVLLGVDGQDGLAKTTEHMPDLVLSDLMMPVMTGDEFCRRVRSDPKLRDLPFILLTAKSNLEAKIEGLEQGADDYLNKPFSEPELVARIGNLIKMRANQRKLKSELRAARDIQQALLPKREFDAGPMCLEALYEPCEELSGDFFDAVVNDEWLYLYLADVTSHGTASAQVTYILKVLFTEAIRVTPAPSLESLMEHVAQRYASHGLEYDVGIQVARCSKTTGVFEYTRGNAPPAIRIDAAGAFTVLPGNPGPALSKHRPAGQDPYEIVSVPLVAGERVFFFTDGCYEFNTHQGRQFGMRRLAKLVADLPKDASWRAACYGQLTKQNADANFDDDITMLCLRLTG